MSRLNYSNLSVIRELRLRRWARMHYVPVEQRPSNWHPIVLDEMAIRDHELQTHENNQQVVASQFVPLAPTPIHILHEAHEGQNEPKLIQSIHEIKKQVEQY